MIRIQTGALLALASSLLAIGVSAGAPKASRPSFRSNLINTTAFPDCADAKPDYQAVVRIVLPRHLNFADHVREVKTLKIPQNNEGPDEDSNGNVVGDQNDQDADELFHVYLKDTGFKGDKTVKYTLVKVIIPRKSDYVFYTGKDPSGRDINGVFAGDASNKEACGILLINDNFPKNKTVASFFIDMSKARNKLWVNFNIGVRSSSKSDTPIFIDPKIYNEG